LDIRATVAGVILRGDLQEVHSAPVDTGQALFEIAPLDQQRLQIRIPEEDVSYVKPGMPVTLHLDAIPGRQLAGAVKQIHPQAEVIDSQNVFVAEVELADVPRGLRPGMHGNAKVVGPTRPLGWVFLHRPWQRLVNYLR
jgi:multidrug efflux pump subunit AcrA (membrane-fusion protein)